MKTQRIYNGATSIICEVENALENFNVYFITNRLSLGVCMNCCNEMMHSAPIKAIYEDKREFSFIDVNGAEFIVTAQTSEELEHMQQIANFVKVINKI